VTDAGKWAGLAMDRSLCFGQLNPAGAEETITANSAPIVGEAKNRLWRKDGRFMLIERTGPVIESRNAEDWSVAGTVPGGLGPDERSASPAGRDMCLGYQPEVGECVFAVSATGGITSEQWPHQIAGETGVFVSPLRKFVTTHRQDEDGFVLTQCRKTPDATTVDVIPVWPVVPQGTKIQGIGWLLWEP